MRSGDSSLQERFLDHSGEPCLRFNIFEEKPSDGSAKQIIEKLIMDAANNRQRMRKAVLKKCENPESPDCKEVRKKLHSVVTEFVGDDKKTPKQCGILADHLAQLIYIAPEIAGIMFDLLLKKEETNEDTAPHLKIQGVLMNDPMTAIYTELDLTNEEGRRKAGIEITKEVRKPNVVEITKEELVIPNVMDLDIIQALAYTDHVQIFAKKSVQAMLYCAWTPIMTPGVRIKTSLALVDLVVLFMWA